LAIAALVDSLGNGMFLTLSAVYFTRIGGLSPAQVGVGLSTGGLAGLVGLVPLGALADRFGPGRIYIILELWQGIGYGAYAFSSGFISYLVISACVGLAKGAVVAINQALVGAAVPTVHRLDTLAKIRAVRNVGNSLGSVFAIATLAQGSRIAFQLIILANAISFFGCAAALWHPGINRPPTISAAKQPFRLVRDRHYLAAALLSGVLSIHQVLLLVTIPLWISTRTKIPIVMVGVLIAINNVMCVVGQARFSAGSRTLRGGVRAMAMAGLAMGSCAMVLFVMGLVRSTPIGIILVIATSVLLTTGELWQSAAAWAIAYGLAPPQQQAQYLTTFQLGTSLQSLIGPTLVTGLVFSFRSGWPVLAVVLCMAGLLMNPVVTRSPAVAQVAHADPPDHPVTREGESLGK
jgi:MFS family permease